MKNYMKKIAYVFLAGMLAGCLTGCGSNVGKSVSIRIANIGNKVTSEEYNNAMHKYYPGVTIAESVDYAYNDENFFSRADNNMVGNLFSSWYTEIDKLAEKGYIADLTEYCKKYNVETFLDPQLKKIVTYNGRIYGIPVDTYVQNLLINKEIFIKAGLVDSNGNIKYPKTYNELAEYAHIISEKTDAAGFVIPSCGGDGGWHLLNIAWSFGTEFEKENASGEWRAEFNSKEFVDALNYIHDLRWKYNATAENVYLDQDAVIRLFGNNKVGMIFCPATSVSLTDYYKLNKDNMMFVEMPKGPYGAYAQMGGNVYMITSSSTDEEIEACFEAMEYMGNLPGVTKDYLSRLDEELNERNRQKRMIEPDIFLKKYLKRYMVNKPEKDISEAIENVYNKYLSLDGAFFEKAFNYENIVVRPEEPVACQDLYRVLDECILTILTDENADIKTIAEEACQKFQTRFLDPVNQKNGK